MLETVCVRFIQKMSVQKSFLDHGFRKETRKLPATAFISPAIVSITSPCWCHLYANCIFTRAGAAGQIQRATCKPTDLHIAVQINRLHWICPKQNDSTLHCQTNYSSLFHFEGEEFNGAVARRYKSEPTGVV